MIQIVHQKLTSTLKPLTKSEIWDKHIPKGEVVEINQYALEVCEVLESISKAIKNSLCLKEDELELKVWQPLSLSVIQQLEDFYVNKLS